MADRFRTTVSAVFWTPSPEAAQEYVDTITATLPEVDRAATLATIEYVAAGRPEPLPPPVVSPTPGGI